MHVRPLNNHLIVKRKNAETRSAGGILLLEEHQEKPCEGEVLAVGKGLVLENGTLIPMSVKPGDIVLFGKFAGTEMKWRVGDVFREYIMLTEDDVLGVVEP